MYDNINELNKIIEECDYIRHRRIYTINYF